MKNNIVMILLSVSCLTLVACYTDITVQKRSINKSPSSDEKEVAVANNPINKSALKTKASSVSLLKSVPISSNKAQVYGINQAKFTAKSTHFYRGERIYNLAINQSAKITGNLVIVLEKSSKISDEIKNLGEISQIAADTYRVKLPEKTNVLSIYQHVSKMPTVKITEMELDYTPRSKQEVR